MKRFSRLQNRLPLRLRPCLQARAFATSTGHDNVPPNPRAQAQAEEAGEVELDKPEKDDFVFDDFEVNASERTVNTAVGSLPMSPIMDPGWREARTRGEEKTRPNWTSLNRFQRKLALNPFAQMLATPVRSCYVTRTRLPRALLQGFGLVRHPETNNVWWVPEGITESGKPDHVTPAAGQADQPAPAGEDAAGSSEATPADTVPSSAGEEAAESSEATPADTVPNSSGEEAAQSSEATPADAAPSQAGTGTSKAAEPKRLYRYPSHVIARRDLLQAFFVPASKHKGGHFRLASDPNVSGLAKSAVWREDMDTAVLDLSRRHIVDELLYRARFCEKEGRQYLVPVQGARHTGHLVHRTCFLWFGGDKSQAEDGPGQYATLDIDGDMTTTRPFYNLPKLLGPEYVQRLKSESSLLREGELFLLRGRRSIKVATRLWNLEGYLADYEKLK